MGEPRRLGTPAALADPARRPALAAALALSLACHAGALVALEASGPAPGSRERPIPIALLLGPAVPETGSEAAQVPLRRAARPAPPPLAPVVPAPEPDRVALEPAPPPAPLAPDPPPPPAPLASDAPPPPAPPAPGEPAQLAPVAAVEPASPALDLPPGPPALERRSGPPAADPTAGPAAVGAPAPDFVLRGGYQLRPRYPQAARLRGAEGTTLLRVYVQGSGRVDEVEVARSAGHADLDRAAVEAVRRWRFEALRDPSGLWVLVPVEFHLR